MSESKLARLNLNLLMPGRSPVRMRLVPLALVRTRPFVRIAAFVIPRNPRHGEPTPRPAMRQDLLKPAVAEAETFEAQKNWPRCRQ